ncbi:MAG: hypothetical protein WD942_08700 [Dehalococcoidia bacterium]
MEFPRESDVRQAFRGVVVADNVVAILKLASGRRATFRTEPFSLTDGILDVRWTFEHDRADTKEIGALEKHIVSSLPEFAATAPAAQLPRATFSIAST